MSQVIALVGGTGFLGRAVARKLVRAGHVVRVIARYPENAAILKTAGDPGQVVLMRGDILKPKSLRAPLVGVDVVVNMVGILFEKGNRQRFAAIHAQGAENLAKAAAEAGVKRFIHLSALGVDQAGSAKYARTKMTGEKAVRAIMPNATILRPSVVFGAEDNFFNQFAALATFLPFLPLIGGGRTKFQPVYVEDVAEAALRAVHDKQTEGKTYSLGGPEVVSFEQILTFITHTIKRDKFLLPLPFSLAKIFAFFAECLPTPVLTRDQVELLKSDNVVPEGAAGFTALGIVPQSFRVIVPPYLARFSPYLQQEKAA